jgi:two-component system sensor histidine kinase CpxA
MVIIAFFIARQFSQTWDVNALSPQQTNQSQKIQLNLQKLLSKDVDIERALRRLSARGRFSLMAVNIANDELVLGFPPPMLQQPGRFTRFKNAQNAVLIQTRNMEFTGPFSISSKGQEYQLFIGRLLRRDQTPTFALSLALAVFLISGTIACVGIAWTITKPIKALSKLSKDFAAGALSQISVPANQDLMQRKDELGQLHNDIHNMASDLAKSLVQQRSLMANISHELRTPLTRMQLAIAMLDPQPAEQVNYAKRIEKDIAVMDVLIGQALQLAKMKDNNHAQWLKREKVTLQKILMPVLDNLTFEAKASTVSLSIENNTSDDFELSLIKVSFVSAIENVTRNAVKFSNKEVKITTSVDVCAQSAKQLMLRICIEDDGEGITDEQRLHIFEPFYRAPSGTQYQGTGLGLAIAKECVDLHNGQISAKRSSMGGLNVTLLFPVVID